MADTLTKELIKEICATGDKTETIPATTESGSNALSYAEGFPIATATPQSDGGIPPKRTDMNKVLNVLSKNQVFLQNGGAYSFDSTIATGIGGYPKGARLLYFEKTEGMVTGINNKYYIESLKDNNTDGPTQENIYVVKNNLLVMQIVNTASDLTTPTDTSKIHYALCLDDGLVYLWSTTYQRWDGYSFGRNQIISNMDSSAIYIFNGTTWVNLNTLYSWIAYNSSAHIPMPDYSAGNSVQIGVEHTAGTNLLVIVNLQGQDDTTRAKFLIGTSVGDSATEEIASFSINGASNRETWTIPVPEGYKYKIEKGNIDTVTAISYPIR